MDQHPEFVAVAQVEAKRAMSQGPLEPPPAGQTVPGVGHDAGPRATAPSVPAVPNVPVVQTVQPQAAPPAGPNLGANLAVPTAPAAPQGAAADLLAALSPAEKAQLLATLQANG
jgi:hypothetical protein